MGGVGKKYTQVCAPPHHMFFFPGKIVLAPKPVSTCQMHPKPKSYEALAKDFFNAEKMESVDPGKT